MDRELGEQWIQDSRITESQMKAALERQRLYGGRLGDNLVRLGYATPQLLERVFSPHPQPPERIEDTGLSFTFICDLVLKHAASMGEFNLAEMSYEVKLPVPIVDQALDDLRKNHDLEVRRAVQLTKAAYELRISQQGQNRAQELLEISSYTGPAPVSLDAYRDMVELQTIKNISIDKEQVTEAFSELIVSDELLERLGPAVNAGKALFLYGPAGNGKTTIAEALGRLLPGAIYVPYAVKIGSEIVTVFDTVTHDPVEPEFRADQVDQRWALVRRPIVIAGSELSTDMLKLELNTISKFYEAPLQWKANNGIFVVDDFGRQEIEPATLLNRWIVPLERRTDYFRLHTGIKFEIPFDEVTVFATNIEPRKLVDEAFLRRIRYKIKIDHPTRDEYEEIFRAVCAANNLEFDQEVFGYLMAEYERSGLELNACHPRDLIDHIIDQSYYRGERPSLTHHGVELAWKNYFVEM